MAFARGSVFASGGWSVLDSVEAVTGHAGKTRRFRVFESEGAELRELGLLDLPADMVMHAYRGPEHPLFNMDVVITGGSGQGFVNRLARHGARVINTSATDIIEVVKAVVAGEELPPAAPHEHEHGPTVVGIGQPK